jgi:predicted DNA-binding protein
MTIFVQYFVLQSEDFIMSRSFTTSIRLTADLRLQLENAAKRLNRDKNWLVSQALTEYLAKLGEDKLVNEAQRQSRLASKADRVNEESDLWSENQDETGWN